MSSSSGPGAIRVKPGTVTINGDRSPDERLTLVIVNTGDRPIQVGSHLHLPDTNSALDFDRVAAHGFRLDIPSGTSVRFEPGISRRSSRHRLVDDRAFLGRDRWSYVHHLRTGLHICVICCMKVLAFRATHN